RDHRDPRRPRQPRTAADDEAADLERGWPLPDLLYVRRRQRAGGKSPGKGATGMSAANFSVPEIHCDGCAASIRKALGGLAGVATVDVDVPGKKVQVEFDATRTNPAVIRARIEAAGFDVD